MGALSFFLLDSVLDMCECSTLMLGEATTQLPFAGMYPTLLEISPTVKQKLEGKYIK